MNNPNNLEGVKHQCDIEYELTIEITVDPFIGSPYLESHTMTVHTLNDATYENPFATACCTDITTHPAWPVEDTCALPHQKACMADLIQHICHAPESWLIKMSLDNVGNGAEAIQEAASDFSSGTLRDACIHHFLFGPDGLNAAYLCDSEFTGVFDHTPFEPSNTWTEFGHDAFDLKVSLTSNFADGGVEPPPTPAETCTEPPDNTGNFPPFSFPSTGGGSLAPTGTASIDVSGPDYDEEPIEGTGAFGTQSVLHGFIDSSSNLVVDQWSMTEHSSTTVGTQSVQVTVDSFELDLVGANVAAINGLDWTIAAGSAVFNLAASIEGVGYSVVALNQTDIDFYEVGGGVDDCPSSVNDTCLVSSAFDITYTDAAAGAWTLSIPEITWMP